MLAAGVGLCWDRPMAGQCLRNVIHMVHLQTALIFHKERRESYSWRWEAIVYEQALHSRTLKGNIKQNLQHKEFLMKLK